MEVTDEHDEERRRRVVARLQAQEAAKEEARLLRHQDTMQRLRGGGKGAAQEPADEDASAPHHTPDQSKYKHKNKSPTQRPPWGRKHQVQVPFVSASPPSPVPPRNSKHRSPNKTPMNDDAHEEEQEQEEDVHAQEAPMAAPTTTPSPSRRGHKHTSAADEHEDTLDVFLESAVDALGGAYWSTRKKRPQRRGSRVQGSPSQLASKDRIQAMTWFEQQFPEIIQERAAKARKADQQKKRQHALRQQYRDPNPNTQFRAAFSRAAGGSSSSSDEAYTRPLPAPIPRPQQRAMLLGGVGKDGVPVALQRSRVRAAEVAKQRADERQARRGPNTRVQAARKVDWAARAREERRARLRERKERAAMAHAEEETRRAGRAEQERQQERHAMDPAEGDGDGASE